ncbi:glycosyltransferase family 39 protein [Mycolicibacterium fortuitum]|uniref:Glycosyltransferase family 39 protein n=2 Tax=Mycolicibacterium fortuitum TaxID=1766 RepID=A0AAE4VJ87_MYCFO|nr:glycosyltransferase family 39 protein [Mycolicibacterium fortuitum]MCV7139991.1 glycosyltransferase family 39 protein [Mycolicibacterium fortuitum]MDG5772105.1 glycosyltransferase family 39 protein [Mycolicibacterium fortuitum]MDG5785458.1 glycosyltransferase family 39 protein [Mycolicibacterium fortuitum]MDV7195466.1 glycosyltransferase family 39 protein [Mycolicibacterium fortuitum]MDV7209343.1 glycosyltransferase family 39 protein [Mycolicibacterium fortuitum]
MDLSLNERAEGAGRRVDREGRFDAMAVAVFAVALCAAGAARPSLWFDEAATISAATRSIPQLWDLIGHIDAVHGLYYLGMHGWFAVFPATEFWSRFSSCLAIGGAAAGVVVLGRQFSGRTVSVCAGVLFAMLPRVTWAGIEARSYSWSTLAAVWLTVLLITAIRRDHRALWAAYGALLVVSTVLNIYVVLIVIPHAAALALLGNRRARVRWAVVSTIAVLIVVPFILWCRSQSFQVGWISPLGLHTVTEVVLEQYFDHSVAFALVAAAMLIAPLVVRRLRPTDSAIRRLVVIAAVWVVAPTAVLLVYSAVAQPLYYPRYLCFTTPAMALLLAVCVVAVARSREWITAALAVFALAATPNYITVQRGPYAKEGMDFSQVADVITAHSSPGDCIVFDNTTSWKPGPIRPITAARPAAYAHLVDPGRGKRAWQRNRLWDAHLGIWGVADQIRRCTVLWTVSERDRSVPSRQSGAALAPGPRLDRAPAYQVPESMGFHIVERWQFNFAQVVKSTR